MADQVPPFEPLLPERRLSFTIPIEHREFTDEQIETMSGLELIDGREQVVVGHVLSAARITNGIKIDVELDEGAKAGLLVLQMPEGNLEAWAMMPSGRSLR